MPRYHIEVTQSQTVYFEFEADSEAHARELFEGGEVDRATAYAGEANEATWNSEEITNIEEV